MAGIKVSYVVSSPSCRARETAIFAFNRIDQIEPSILHRTAQMKSQYKDLGNKFRQVIDEIPIEKGSNIVISGHGGTLSYDLKNGFGPWKEMLLANGHKLKEHGMTCIFAATEKDNDNKLTVILDFATPEGMMGFKNDEELTQRRIEAGAMVETTVMTPMTSEAVTNFSG